MQELVGAVDTIIDHTARRTIDNVTHAQWYLGEAPCVIVTSRFHLPRALLLARFVGLRARGVAADGSRATASTLAREGVSWLAACVDVARR